MSAAEAFAGASGGGSTKTTAANPAPSESRSARLVGPGAHGFESCEATTTKKSRGIAIMRVGRDVVFEAALHNATTLGQKARSSFNQ